MEQEFDPPALGLSFPTNVPPSMTSSAATPQQPGSASYVRVLRERWPVIVATAIVCVAAGLITQQLLPTNYSAEADVQILPIDNSDSTFVGADVFRNLSS